MRDSQAFVIRIWSETREIEGAPAVWRGVIEYVPSGDKQYFKSLDEIAPFVARHLAQMGVKLSLQQRFRLWRLERTRKKASGRV